MTDTTESPFAENLRAMQDWYENLTPEERAERERIGREQDKSIDETVRKGTRGYKA